MPGRLGMRGEMAMLGMAGCHWSGVARHVVERAVVCVLVLASLCLAFACKLA